MDDVPQNPGPVDEDREARQHPAAGQGDGRLSREEYDRLVAGVDDHFFGSTESDAMDEPLRGLFDGNLIDLNRGSVFDRTPGPPDLDDLRKNGRVEGMLLGLAAGDALGLPTEFTYTPERRRAELGTIRGHEDNPAEMRGSVSDDTQMSFWTLERLLAFGRFDLDDLARCLVDRWPRIIGIGGTVAHGLGEQEKRLRDGGVPPLHLCPGPGRGDGTLMRYAPLLLPHLRSPSPGLWRDVALASFLTHGNTVPLSATLAFAHLLWEVLRRLCGDVPEPEWWLDEYVAVAAQVERLPESPYQSAGQTPALSAGHQGLLCELVDREVRAAWRRGVPLREAVSPGGFGSASDCLQAVPAALYVLMSHAGSFEDAVVAAVNDTKDNDTIASVVGAILGALHGRKAVPRRWLDGITSSVVAPPEADREVIERLAGQAVARFL